MKLTPPKKITFWISLLLGLAGVVMFFIPGLVIYGFWVLFIGMVLLVLGLLLKGF